MADSTNVPENMTLAAIVEGDDSGGVTKGSRTSFSDRFGVLAQVAILLVVVVAPWAFGSVEYWAQKWISIGLLVGLALWWFDTALNERKTQAFPYISVLVFLGIGIGLFQVIPLPEGIVDAVVGRQKEIYEQFTGDDEPVVSISLDRERTWGQIRLLLIALAGLLLGARYFRTKRDVVLLLSVMTLNGVAISFFGIVHKLTSNGKLYWVRDLTLGGNIFGPFVNRNNAAGYLLMCLACSLGLLVVVMSKRVTRGPRTIVSKEIPLWRQISYYAAEFLAELTATKLAVLIAVVLIASGIAASLSRGAVLALLAGGFGTVLIYGIARRPKNLAFVLAPMAVLVLALSGWLGFGDDLIGRFENIDATDVSNADSRMQHWRETWPVVNDMGWLGSGLGSYRGVHRLYRTTDETTLFYYAENQFFQAVVEAGWPGLILFLLAWILAYQYAALTIFRGSSPTTIGVGVMGVFLIFSQSIASFFDFGLYIPSNTILFSFLIGFLGYQAQALAGRLKKQSWLRFQVPNYFVQVIVLAVFAGVTIVSVNLHRRSNLERLMRPRAVSFNRLTMDLETTEQRLTELLPLIANTKSTEALNYAGELWLHRARLLLHKSMFEEPAVQSSLLIKDPEEVANQLWPVTHIQRVHENIAYIRREQSQYEASRLIRSQPIRSSLPNAASYFWHSRRQSPLQPFVHVRLGQIQAVIGEPESAGEDFERALRLAPGNASFRRSAGIYYLQAGNPNAAVPHLAKHLELKPRGFKGLMDLVTGRTSRSFDPIAADVIGDQVLPQDPKMIFDFVVNYLPQDSVVREQLLKRAAQILDDEPFPRRESNLLMGEIRIQQGELDGAVEVLKAALVGQPNDPKTRYKRAKLLVELGRLEDALDEADYLCRTTKNKEYNNFLAKLEAMVEAEKEF